MREIIIGTKREAVGKLIGKGGEGEVYAVKGRNDQAVKIYNPELRSIRKDKVCAMVGEMLAAKTNLVSFPRQIVFDRRGNFLGFQMRLVSGHRSVHELYSPKSRQRHFPEADYRFVVRAALNVARSVGMVHQTGCVIGDLNHSSVMVSQNATVALIDADSFQFRLNGEVYPCMVGVPDFTPPELHGVNLGAVVRTIVQDNFSLAVVIFHLLFMGRHPYAGQYNGPDISMCEAIAQNRFAFSLKRRSLTQTTPPPDAMTLDLLPALLIDAFERSFGPNPSQRPSALDWVEALTRLEGLMRRCIRVRTHYFPGNVKSCVWCDLSRKSGFDMFPDLSMVAPNILPLTFNTKEAIVYILNFRFPSVAELITKSTSSSRKGSYTISKAKISRRNCASMGVLIITCAVAGYIFEPAMFLIWFSLCGLGVVLTRDYQVDAKHFQNAFQRADERLQFELDIFAIRTGLAELVKVHEDLKAAIESYNSVEDDLANELMKHKSTREARQLTAYLDQFSIRHARMAGVGRVKTALLISCGIKTAADVKRSPIFRTLGFCNVATDKLLNWLAILESGFRYNTKRTHQDIAEEKSLCKKFAIKKAEHEAIIRNGFSILKAAKSKFKILPALVRKDLYLMEAIEARAKAIQDLRVLGVHVPTSDVALSTIPLQNKPVRSRLSDHKKTRPSVATSTVSSVPNCPRCGAPMRHQFGMYTPFWGCSKYPRCRGTRNLKAL